MTIRSALQSQYPHEEIAPAGDWAGVRSLQRPLHDYKLFVGHFRYFLRRLLPEDTKAFTILRDPVDRAISHLKHLASDPQFHSLHELARGRDLRAIAQDRRIMSQCSNVMVGYLSRPRREVGEEILRCLRPEDEFCRAPDAIDDAIAALDQMDFVGFVDDLENDFARICDLLGLHPPQSLPVINSAVARQDCLSADIELREIVREANKLDCAFYREALRRRSNRAAVPTRLERIEGLMRRGVYEPINQSTDFPISGPLPGYGFWRQDLVPGSTPIRWTGPGRELVLEMPIDRTRKYTLEFKAFFRQCVGKLAIQLDGAPVRCETPGALPKTAKIKAPIYASARSKPFSTITIRIDKTAQAGEADPRQVGFALSNLRLVYG